MPVGVQNHIIYEYIIYICRVSSDQQDNIVDVDALDMGSESIEEFDVLEDCQEKQLTPDVGADEVLFVVVGVVVVFSCSVSSSTLEL